MKDVELTQIVKEVQKDIGQFELLYSQIINKVYFWCYTVIGNDADAKDAAQEAMIRIYKNVAKLKEPENFTSWMYVIVRNACYNYLRYHKSESKTLMNSGDFVDAFDVNVKDERKYVLPEEAYNLKEMKELVSKFVSELPRKQREAITLFYLDEFKIEEIANLLQCPVGSVKSRLHDGRKKLQEKVNDYQEENDMKLYGIVFIPFLGLILKEYRETICARQTLDYDETIYKGKSAKKSYKKIASSKMIISSLVLIVIFILITPLFVNNKSETDDYLSNGSLFNLEMYNKLKENPYIEDIVYLTFPTRTTVDVSIILKQDFSKEEIKITHGKKELSFEKKNNELFIQVEENGEYTISIKNENTTFTIDRIDKYAPEFLGIINYDNYIQLMINDGQSQVNYETSFVEYEGEHYSFGNDLRVDGRFNGTVKITLFHKDGYFMKYSIDLK
ncbi:RNA polymerase sigma factor [Breznakia pachnodae]|uniref:RNA polymerase sigma factor (Sigma-70 family) n=1 Tax=Breznakia pachnodae TaxID=265178 RepID=A0ABU0E216_9FIRM|nr:RNA polymerase sigma factor [Breznakia pachnodae]MDQ0360929.1 RNA polymerase sigma factor (sigma-70 family) [Breznakia pachnodae]